MKILYVTTIGSTMGFFASFIKKLIEDGNNVDIATNENIRPVPDCYKEWNCKIHQIDTSRSPLSKGNLTAYKQLKKLVKKGEYDIIHCHTPVAAMLTRLACRKVRKKGTRVIYTAHGFHFYKGSPKLNWLIYYPIEKICSYFTDVLITINKEDYALAQKKMKAKKVEYVQGVGIEVEKFANPGITREQKRAELGIPQDAKLLISVGELNKNKNHETVIRAIKDLDVYYIIAGIGDLQDYLQNLINELNLTNRVKLLGYRTDVAELYAAADIFAFPSFREGLGLAAIEGMAFGLPLVVADNRGTRDFCEKDVNGFLCNPLYPDEFKKAIEKVLKDSSLAETMRQANIKKAKDFDVEPINDKMLKIYCNRDSMKILYVTTISRTMNFFKSFISELVKGGHSVEFACNCDCPVDNFYNDLVCNIHNLPFSRSPLNKSNLTAYKQLKKLVESGKYDIVHCHTPIAAMLTRLACRKVRKKGTRVIYTAHGFHFYKGSPKLNWLLFYTVEKICSYFTDVLITINKEDYALAQKKLKAKKIEYGPGVGIFIDKFQTCSSDIENLRLSFGFKNDDFVLISIGELSIRKNHEVIIKALGKLGNPNIKYLIVGDGNLEQKLKDLAKELKIENQVVFAGYRRDISDLLHAADAFVFPSLQEGLPVALMEAMASGLPIVCSCIRGNTDLIVDGEGGYLVNPKDVDGFAKAIKTLIEKYDTLQEMVKTNTDIIKKFDIKHINKVMFGIYKLDINLRNT